ncbi:hypothetical protein BHE74_00008581 [Ensete ventricosum]|nr:hypothetical protein BHE74_00008581 [Ensete ventricosum]
MRGYVGPYTIGRSLRRELQKRCQAVARAGDRSALSCCEWLVPQVRYSPLSKSRELPNREKRFQGGRYPFEHKEWKLRFFFVSTFRGWGFGLK